MANVSEIALGRNKLLRKNAAKLAGATLNVTLWEHLQQLDLVEEGIAFIPSSEGDIACIPLEILLRAPLESKVALIERLEFLHQQAPKVYELALRREEPVDGVFNGPYP